MFKFSLKIAKVGNLLQANLLKKVSLARWSLSHLPPCWQGHVVRNLIRRLTEMLRRGTRRCHSREGATRNGSQLQGGWGGVCSDVVGGEHAAAPSIGAGLRRGRDGQNTPNIVCVFKLYILSF